MYEYLINQIQTICNSIPAVKEVFSYPLEGSPSKYPAIVFYPDNTNNTISDTTSNFKNYNFKIFVLVALSGTNTKNIFNTIMPNVCDKIFQKFDETWNGGTVDGYRVWKTLNTAQWGITVAEKSRTAFVEFNLEIKVSTSS